MPHEILGTICGLFRLLNNAMQARFWSVFKVGEQVSIIFWIHRLAFIMLNVGMVDNLEFWSTIFEFRGPKHVPLPGFTQTWQSHVITFFALIRAFAVFLFKVSLFIVLWIFTSNISPHFAEFAGIKLTIISAR